MVNGESKASRANLLKETCLSTSKTLGLLALIGAAGVGMSGPASAVTIIVTPEASAAVTFTDNVYLTDGAEEEDTIISANLGLSAYGETARFSTNFRYQLSYDAYDTATEFDGLRHDLRTSNTWEASPDFFFVDLNASIRERTIDRTTVRSATPRTYGGDQTRVSTVTLSPYIRTVLGGDVRLEARLEASSVGYSETDVGDGVVQPEDRNIYSARVQVDNEDAAQPLTFSLMAQTRDYDDDRVTTDVLGSVFYNMNGTTRLIARVGLDQIDSDGDGDEEFDESFWRVGFETRPTPRTIFRFESGERFDQTTYDLQASHQFRDSFGLSATYTHQVTTDAGQFVQNSADPVFDDEGNLIGLENITTEIFDDTYIARRARVTASGVLSDFSYQVGLAYLDREFEFSPNDEQIFRISARGRLLVSERMAIIASAADSNEDAFVAASEVDITRFTAGLSWRLTETASFAVQAVSQSYEYGTGIEIDENAVVVSISNSW